MGARGEPREQGVGNHTTHMRVFDRIHGDFDLSPLLCAFVGSEALRRLDGIRQLGACAFVYHCATHTRREHSIGVAHLAGCVGRHLKTRHPECGVTARDVVCLQVAGLCHDIGHGPFSHLFERFARAIDRAWDHETMGIRILEHVLEHDAHVAEEFRSALTDGTAESFKRSFECVRLMILGLDEDECVPLETGHDESRRFLFEIVHCRGHGLDVDRIDYLCRDCAVVLNNNQPFSMDRIVNSVRVVKGKLSFHESVAFEVSEIFLLRARMHRQVYQHRNVLVADDLVLRLLETVDRRNHLLTRSLHDVPTFLWLQDASVMLPDGDEVADQIRRSLHSRPWLRRVPYAVSINTMPRCATCSAPVRRVTDRACSACGSMEKWSGVVGDDGVMRSMESVVSQDSVRLATSHQYSIRVAHIFFGSRRTVKDVHGRHWSTYDAISNLRFCSDDVSLTMQEQLFHMPPRSEERIAYCFSPCDVTEGSFEELTRAFSEWGRTVGSETHLH